MKVLFVAAEVGPYVSVGGLSQVSYFLTRALSRAGESVAVFTPKFGAMDETAVSKKGWRLKTETEGLRVPTGKAAREEEVLICNVKSYENRKQGVKTFFLENREYFELRANVFGYKDDHVRFALLSKGCLEWIKHQKQMGAQWRPDIIHCNDWHTAYLIEMARTDPRYRDLLKKIPIVLTVHNFSYQGNFEFNYCTPAEKDNLKKPLLPLLDPKMHKQNPLKRGVKWADLVTTVSPTHAREVMTKEYGEGMEELMVKMRSKVSGILNGLDYEEFDPKKDLLLHRRFELANFERVRKINKRYLQEEFGLPKKPEAFLMAYSGRLANQKGVGIMLETMKHLLPERADCQLIVLGGGDDMYRRSLRRLAGKFPKQVGLHLIADFVLPRRIFAGTDVLLLPSLFEPGGIVALEALRYGAVPVVRRTGGLNDIVRDFEPQSKKGNGFSFERKDAWSLYGAIGSAYTTHQNKKLWLELVKNCLKCDFSWEYAAKEYQTWYKLARAKRKRMVEQLPHVAYIKGR